MSETTIKISKVQQQLMTLTTRVDDVSKLLRANHQMLRKRGVNLPATALDGLRNLKGRIDKLSKTIVNSKVELQQLRSLAGTTALISSSHSTEEVLNQVMDTVISLTGAERGYIVLANKETGELEFTVARGMDAGDGDSSEYVISRSIVTKVAQTGDPILTDNASGDERFMENKSIANLKLRSILAVPLKVREEIIGVAYCDNRFLSGLFKQQEMDLLAAFAQQAAVAIENARLFEAQQSQHQEITEIRDLMNNIFTSIASGVMTMNNQGIVTTSNQSALAITGVHDPLGRPINDILSMVDESVIEHIEAVKTGAQDKSFIEVEFDGPSRTHYWNVLASPLKDRHGNTEGVAIVFDDLTDLKYRESQLAEAGKYLPDALVANLKSPEAIDMSPQEREITALFADVRGFTAFSQNLDPQDLMRIINQYLSVASDAINLYEGIVDKYMGDAVTGLWNTQLNPQADHAVRAIQAAQSIMYDLFALHEVLADDQQLFFGVGIHSGQAVLGSVGSEERKEFAALGEAMDACKFLQESAGPGEIIISEETYHLVEEFYECEPMAPTKTKAGFEHFTTVYKVGRRKKGAGTQSLFVDQELLDLLND